MNEMNVIGCIVCRHNSVPHMQDKKICQRTTYVDMHFNYVNMRDATLGAEVSNVAKRCM